MDLKKKKILGHAGHVDLVNNKNILPLLPYPVLPCDLTLVVSCQTQGY